jgi:fatty acid synthase
MTFRGEPTLSFLVFFSLFIELLFSLVVTARNSRKLGTCVAGGVEMLDLHTAVTSRREGAHRRPILETYIFVPYIESSLASTYGETSLAEYSQVCNSFVLAKLRHLIQVGIHNGLQNRELMCRLFLQQTAACPSLPDGKLREYLDAADCTVLRTLDQLFSIEHNEHFIEGVESVVRSAWSDIAVVDKLTSFIRCERCFKTCLDVVLENIPFEGTNISKKKVNVVEYDAGIGQAFRHTIRQLSSQNGIFAQYFVTGPNSLSEEIDNLPHSINITPVNWSLNNSIPVPDQLRNSDVVILANALHRQPNLLAALALLKKLLRDGRFLLVIEPTMNFVIPWAFFALTNNLSAMSDIPSRSFGPFCDESTWIKIFSDAGFQVVAQKSDGLLNTAFLCRSISQSATPSDDSFINIDGTSFSWLEDVKTIMADEVSSGSSVWIRSDEKPLNGIVGLVNCLRLEPNGSRLR